MRLPRVHRMRRCSDEVLQAHGPKCTCIQLARIACHLTPASPHPGVVASSCPSPSAHRVFMKCNSNHIKLLGQRKQHTPRICGRNRAAGSCLVSGRVAVFTQLPCQRARCAKHTIRMLTNMRPDHRPLPVTGWLTGASQVWLCRKPVRMEGGDSHWPTAHVHAM